MKEQRASTADRTIAITPISGLPAPPAQSPVLFPRPPRWTTAAFESAAVWAAISSATFLGAWFGYLQVGPDKSCGFLESLALIDGQNYKQVAETGYAFQEKTPSSVAFFPAYPLSARWLARTAGIGIVPALLVISNFCCLAAFVAMGLYMQGRCRRNPEGDLPLSHGICRTLDLGRPPLARVDQPQETATYALLAMGLLPTTLFFHLAYTESMFLFAALLTLYGIRRSWRAPVVAMVVGLATAVRPVGVALLLPLAFYVWKRSGSKRQAAFRLAYVLPIACWGLGAYMIFQWWKFGQPLAFALTQTYHRVRPMGSSADKWLALLSWEPIRDTYNPVSPGYWMALHYYPSRLFSLEFANPIYFLGTAALIALGAWKKWLTSYEILLAVPLLAIPYFTRAYEMRMLSQARFASVVFPVYIVLGHLLAKLPIAVSGALLGLSGLFLGIYAALFAAGYPFL